MKLKLTSHFQQRIAERSLNIDHVKDAISSPDQKIVQDDGKIRAIKTIGDKTIIVVYCKENFKDKKDEYLLISAFYPKT